MKNIVIGILIAAVILIGGFYFLNQYIYQEKQGDSISKNQIPTGENLSLNPPKDCKAQTPQQTEGPYYKEGSPQRANLREEGITGEAITITGYVMDPDCNPVSNTWLDFWQADGQGNYDNEGFKLRGHQFTDAKGRYQLETVIPGEYPGRTPHIHVKVRKDENSEILTSQLYFPGKEGNLNDSIFSEDLLIKVEEGDGRKIGYYNFIISN